MTPTQVLAEITSIDGEIATIYQAFVLTSPSRPRRLDLDTADLINALLDRRLRFMSLRDKSRPLFAATKGGGGGGGGFTDITHL